MTDSIPGGSNGSDTVAGTNNTGVAEGTTTQSPTLAASVVTPITPATPVPTNKEVQSSHATRLLADFEAFVKRIGGDVEHGAKEALEYIEKAGASIKAHIEKVL